MNQNWKKGKAESAMLEFEAKEMEKAKKEFQKQKTTWHKQYLRDESLYYLTELHPEDGILGEFFFNTQKEMDTYIKKNKIVFKS